ncbi:MAG TPA: MFS transporter [Hyphomicrobiales bacterium]|nr:MFS transporter [Hyphomicrobiales bacterium]
MRAVPRRAVVAWILFDPAAQPVFTLITTFVFAPYFAGRLAATPAEGQALWGFATAGAGVVIAVLSPILGAIADAAGRRKPWIAAFSVLLVLGCVLLWFTPPGAANSIPLALAGFIVATLGVEFATVFNNAMMPDLVPAERLGRLSGTGWAVGYVGGLVSLVLMLSFALANPATDRTIAGLVPVFGLDPATGGGDRLSGPLSALWYVVLVLPLFLFVPDRPRRMAIGAAVRGGLAELVRTLRALGGRRNAALYLLAHMIYADGLVALFAFGGLYATGIFGWTSFEIGLFGILLTITGTIGALAGGPLDDRFGPKPVVMGSLLGLIVAAAAILSISHDRIFFVVPVAPPVHGHGLFAATGERLYLALGAVIGGLAGPLQAASRTLLARLAPREEMTQFFGLYALTGTLTSFAGPLLVGAVTAWTADQRAGMSILLVFFVTGAVLLAAVRAPRR